MNHREGSGGGEAAATECNSGRWNASNRGLLEEAAEAASAGGPFRQLRNYGLFVPDQGTDR